MSDLVVFRTTTAVFRARRSWPVCIGIAPVTSVSHKDHKAGNATASLACWLPDGNALSMVDFAECASEAQRVILVCKRRLESCETCRAKCMQDSG